jgi:Uma2 family endonuclease
MPTLKAPTPRPFRWTVEKYDRLARGGFFDGRRVELIEGRIIEMPPQTEPHVLGVTLARQAAAKAFGDGYYVRPPAPIRQGERSKPEPDVAVVLGNPRDYAQRDNPPGALLVIEISDSSLRYDRGKKASLYAKHGIADYWIVNLVDRQLEVHRDPVADRAHPHGCRYANIQILKAPASIAPLAAAQAAISVADLMP